MKLKILSQLIPTQWPRWLRLLAGVIVFAAFAVVVLDNWRQLTEISWHLDATPLAELFLMLAARADLIAHVIRPALDAGYSRIFRIAWKTRVHNKWLHRDTAARGQAAPVRIIIGS